MTYRLGIDVGNAQTTWAVIAGRPDSAPDSGIVNSVVTIVQTDDVHLVRDFVRRLGEPDPVIIGGTPYGAESLLARLIGGILATVRRRQGEEPAALVLAHDDGLDPYRSGLYAEAGRLAGLPAAAVFIVARAEAVAAVAAAPGVTAAVGAAAVGWQRVPTPVDDEQRGGAAAVVLGTGASGAVIAAAAGDAIGGATAFSGAGGPLGGALGSAGPAGTPLGGVGPTGTALPAPGAAGGTPLSGPPAPPGTPLAPGATAPPPLSGPPAPAGTPGTPGTPSTVTPVIGEPPTTTLPVADDPPVAPPPPRGGTGPLVDVGDAGLRVHIGWRRFLPVFAISLVLLIGLITTMAFMLGGSDAPSVAPASTAARIPPTTARPAPSVLAPTSAPRTTVGATTRSSTSTTSTTPPTTTAPATTAPATTVPRTTVRATIPPTMPPTIAPTTTAPTTTMPNTPPAIGAALVSPAIVTACGPSTITVDVADPTGVASVAVNYSYAVDKASSASGTANLAGPTGGGTWSGSFTLPVNTGFGQTALSLTVTATDAQGLATQTSPQFFQAAAC